MSVQPSLLTRVLLALYPPSFRSHYGEEMALVISARKATWRSTIDLAFGVLRAWTFPVFPGDKGENRRLRMQATAVMAVVAWAWSVVGFSAFSRAVDDQPIFPAVSTAHMAFFTLSQLAIWSGVGAAVIGFTYWAMIVRRAWHARRWDILKPAFAPALVVLIWGLVAVVGSIAVTRSLAYIRVPFLHFSVAAAALGLFAAVSAWAVVLCVKPVWLAVSRARLSSDELAVAVGMTAIGALTMVFEAISALVCTLTIPWHGVAQPLLVAEALIPLCLLALCATAISVSSFRGVRMMITGR